MHASCKPVRRVLCAIWWVKQFGCRNFGHLHTPTHIIFGELRVNRGREGDNLVNDDLSQTLVSRPLLSTLIKIRVSIQRTFAEIWSEHAVWGIHAQERGGLSE